MYFNEKEKLHQSSASDRNKFTQTKSGDIATPDDGGRDVTASACVLKGKGGKEERKEAGWRKLMAELAQ